MKKKLVIGLIVSALVISGGIHQINAATHVHSADCYDVEVVHTHSGTPKTKAGCYKGSSYTASCGGKWAYYDTQYRTVQGPNGSMTISYDRCKCSVCGEITTVSSDCYDDEYRQYLKHTWTAYNLNCGYTEGTSYKLFYHKHVGKQTVRSGCYMGNSSQLECGGTVNRVGTDSKACGYNGCSGSWALTLFKCSLCGNQFAAGNCGTCGVGTGNVPMRDGKCTVSLGTVYALSCGYTEQSLLDCNGVLHTNETVVCNKKIKSITSKTKTQTIVR